MLRTLRSRLLVGIAPLLAIMVGLGLWAVVMFSRLGGNIDVILRENYRSVLAAQNMKEALERMDSALLFAIGGQEDAGTRAVRASSGRPSRRTCASSGATSPCPGEQAIGRRAGVPLRPVPRADASATSPCRRPTSRGGRGCTSASCCPTFNRIKDRADDVLDLNQRNMEADGPPGAHGRRGVDPLDDRRPARFGRRRHADRAAAEPVDPRADPGGDARRPRDGPGRSRPGRAGPLPRRAGRAGRRLQRDGPHASASSSRPGPPGSCGPRRRRRRRSTRSPTRWWSSTRRARSSGPTRRPAASSASTPSDGSIPWAAPPPLRPALAEVLGGRPDYLPTGLEHTLCLRDDGQERFFLPRVLAIRGEDGPLGAAVVLQDVTKFRLVDQLKSDMVSTVSHELKTPLTSIQMAVHLLLEEAVGPLTPKQVELLLAARQDSDRLLAMVNDLLDLTRIEQGRVRLDLGPVAPADLVGEAVERFEARARDAGVELKADVASGLPPVRVDRERVAHVFDNLVGNALAHTGRGGSIRLSAEADGDSVRFAVADTGEGIAAEHLPRIFEKFYRVPGSRSAGGAGLGLAIAREIVAAHGGQIDVASRPGEGTTFTFRLPIAREADGQAHREGATS